MKKVLLIGDSIRLGYDKSVKKSLEGIAEVYYPAENCRFASYVLRYLGEYGELAGEGGPDVIHWNAGLWDNLRLYEDDPHTPIEVYAYYIRRICLRIRKLFPHADVIFATSTAVQEELMDKDFKRYNAEIEAYNEAALAVVREFGFAVNDLYPISRALPDEAHSDTVHYYTSMGTEALTKPVLAALAPYLGAAGEIPYREVLHVEDPIGI